jgi:hypothetical protein
MSHGYGKESHAINEGIKGGDAGKLKSNQDVRKYAHGVYKDAGLKMQVISLQKIAVEGILRQITCGKTGTIIARTETTLLQKQK